MQNTFAQNEHKASLDIALDGGIKAFPGKGTKWMPFFQPSLMVRIDGSEPNSLGFIGMVGVLIDPVRVHLAGRNTIQNGQNIDVVQHNIVASGLISFPTRKEDLKILGGINLDFCPEPNVGYGIYSSGTGQFYVDLDSALKTVNEYRRKILPSVSFGANYKFLKSKRLSGYFLIRQNLLHLFTEDIQIQYVSNQQHEIVTFNYRPTYLKLGISYSMWK